MRKGLLFISFAMFFCINFAYSQDNKKLEDYIYKNTNLKNVTLKSKKEVKLKLATFSDSGMTIRFLLESDLLPPDLSFEQGNDIFAAPAKVNESDTLIVSKGLFFNLNYPPDACPDRDFKKLEECNKEDEKRGEVTPCPGMYLEQSNECIKITLIDSVVRYAKSNEFTTAEFFNRIKKMNFKIEKILVEKYYFSGGGHRGNGYNPLGINVFVLDGKPIAHFEHGIIIN